MAHAATGTAVVEMLKQDHEKVKELFEEFKLSEGREQSEIAKAAMQELEVHAEVKSNATPSTVVFYDGVCGLCNRLNQFLLRRDRQGHLAYATLQGTLAREVLARHGADPSDLNTVYVVADGDERALLLGDVVHSVVELHERDWEAVFDVDPVAARAVRNEIADEVADSTDLVVGAHFPGLRFGRVVTAVGNRTFQTV